MGKLTLTALALFQAMGLGVVAAAYARGDREPPTVNRVNRQQGAPTPSYQGTLICAGLEPAEGQSCDLHLATPSGKQLDLSNNSDAMRLYKEGKREVAIEGQQTGDYVRVIKIRPL